MRSPSHDILFEPVKIGPVQTKNRFYVTPHATGNGHLNPNMAIGFREMKAKGGWGVVSTAITEIGPDCDLGSHPVERLWDEHDLPVHIRQAERIHAHGALAAIELGHVGIRARNFLTGLPVIGPSTWPAPRPEMPMHAKAMSLADIRAFRAEHRRAALLARRAGYDIVYVYAAHDISIFNNFLSRRTNRRSDDYGGSLENRARLLREVLEETREAVGDRCAVALRFSVHEFVSDFAIRSDGEGRDVVAMLAEFPDLWDVNISGWSYDSSSSRLAEEGFQEPYTAFVKTLTGKPVVGVGRYTGADRMAALVRKGHLDLIGAARPSIADPFLPQKIEAGRYDDIRECIGCNHCVATESYGVAVRCTQNPTINEEWRRGWHPEEVPQAAKAENILIIGGGVAGLECALTAARAGHHVSVAEARAELGGRAANEAKLAGLSAWRRLVDYRVGQLRQMANVDLYPASAMTAEDAVGFGADRIVLATGSAWRRDGLGSSHAVPIVGLDSGMAIFTPDDVFTVDAFAHSVLIYDDDHDYMGSVLAEELARKGHRVTLMTPLAEFSSWTAQKLERDRIVARLLELGVELLPLARLEAIEAAGVRFRAGLARTEQSRDCRAVILVMARQGGDSLRCEILARGFAAERLHVIGDAEAPGTLAAAVFSGHALAETLARGRGLADFKRDRAVVESD